MRKFTISNLPDAFLQSHTFEDALHALAAYLRAATNAADALRELLDALKQHSEANAHLSALFHHWLQHASLYTGFVQTGIYSRHGFVRELKRRLYDRINPPPRDAHNLGDLLQTVLRPGDLDWLNTIPPLQWLMLYRQLDHTHSAQSARHVRNELLYAAEMLSLWIAAEDLDPDLIRLDPRLLEYDSPFISLQRDVQAYIDGERGEVQHTPPRDHAAIAVMLEQSREQIARLKRLGNHSGASLATGHLLERLEQSVDRLGGILAILMSDSAEKSARAFLEQLGQIVTSGLEQRSIRTFTRNTTGMLSKSISASKSHHGEHYITTTRREYRQMFRSAAGAGILIALMALVKIHIARWHLPPFWETVLISLNYGAGFVIIHLLGCTIATKQPAMTAASIASAVEQGQNSRALEKHLSQLLISVNRSQTVAVLGNLTLAMLTAALVAHLWQHWQGAPLLSADETAYQLKAVQPVPALWYAAIAALWLFCAGLISGYYDNRADYLRLRERLAAHPGLAFLGEAKRAKLADYLHDHFGALHGNFAFGVLLGITPFIGDLLALPLDIRHIAFSSANISYAGASGDLTLGAWLYALLGVALIGLVNLWASFFLALRVALRARDTDIPSTGKLLRTLWQHIRERPRDLILPPQEAEDRKAA
ncbi:MAG: recombinase [Cardiobacteriaceae bacterium]|nr:recombinase [Cardiobacteriaceae bacterium]